jgi:hypothetical protein
MGSSSSKLTIRIKKWWLKLKRINLSYDNYRQKKTITKVIKIKIKATEKISFITLFGRIKAEKIKRIEIIRRKRKNLIIKEKKIRLILSYAGWRIREKKESIIWKMERNVQGRRWR